jgi:hypothetical protein
MTPMTEGEKIAERAATVGAPMTEAERIAAQMTAPAKRMVATAPPPKASGRKVTIACKLPIPWIDLSISKLVEKNLPGLNGSKVVKEAIRTGEFIRVRGTAYPRAGAIPDGFPDKPMMMNGFALTANVDEDKWLAYLNESGGRNSEVVKNGLLFAYPNISDVKSRTLEMRDVKTGLEPLDPRTDADGKSLDIRAPRKTTVGRVEAGQVNTEQDSETRLYELLEQQEARIQEQAEAEGRY